MPKSILHGAQRRHDRAPAEGCAVVAEASGNALADTISAIGTRDFGPALMMLGRHWFGAAQLVAFQIRGRSACSTILAENEAGDCEKVRALADSYCNEFRNDDPNRNLLVRSASRTILCRVVRADHLDASAYRENLFDKPRLAGKIMLLARRRQMTVYLNFYRGTCQAPFDAADLHRLEGASRTLLALLDRHLALGADAKISSDNLIRRISTERYAELSDREHRVCTLLLDGFSIKAAAAQLDVSEHSAVSYRRRAFLKLGIDTQKDLFALAIGIRCC
jgi:DNA-binding CsgD family transcriptional regulator